MRAATSSSGSRPPAGQHDRGAFLRQRQRRRLADAAAAARDPDDLPLEPPHRRLPSQAGAQAIADRVVIASEAKQSRDSGSLVSDVIASLSAPLLAMTRDPLMPIPFLFLPPQGDKTRDWARRLARGRIPNWKSSRRRRWRGPSRRSRWPRAPMARSRRTSWRAPRNCAGCRRRRRRRRPASTTRS